MKDNKIASLFEKFERMSEKVLRDGSSNDFSRNFPFTPVFIDPDKQSVVYRFELDHRFRRTDEAVPNGVLYTILDIAQGASVSLFAEREHFITTASLQISSFQTIYTKAPLFVRVNISRYTKTMAFCSAEVWQTLGELNASSNSIYYLGKIKENGFEF